MEETQTGDTMTPTRSDLEAKIAGLDATSFKELGKVLRQFQAQRIRADIDEALAKGGADLMEPAIETPDVLRTVVLTSLQILKNNPNMDEVPEPFVDALYKFHLIHGITKKRELNDEFFRAAGRLEPVRKCVLRLLREAKDNADPDEIEKYLTVARDLKMDEDPKMAEALEASK